MPIILAEQPCANTKYKDRILVTGDKIEVTRVCIPQPDETLFYSGGTVCSLNFNPDQILNRLHPSIEQFISRLLLIN